VETREGGVVCGESPSWRFQIRARPREVSLGPPARRLSTLLSSRSPCVPFSKKSPLKPDTVNLQRKHRPEGTHTLIFGLPSHLQTPLNRHRRRGTSLPPSPLAVSYFPPISFPNACYASADDTISLPSISLAANRAVFSFQSTSSRTACQLSTTNLTVVRRGSSYSAEAGE